MHLEDQGTGNTPSLPVGIGVGSLPNAESYSFLYPWLINITFRFAHTLKFVCPKFRILTSERIVTSICSIYPLIVPDTSWW
jgi:hypothetical protein